MQPHSSDWAHPGGNRWFNRKQSILHHLAWSSQVLVWQARPPLLIFGDL
jgi:hypothetical protein